MQIDFARQSYRHDSAPISSQRLLNLYSEAQPQGSKAPVSLHGAPGIATFATAGTGPVRGFRILGGVLHTVSGDRLFSVTNDPTPVVTNLGGAISGSGIVSMADNGDQLMTVNSANGYVYDTASGFRLVTDADFNAANTTAYHSGFFVFDQIGTNRFFLSDSLDGDSYDPLRFASKEAKSDFLRSVVNVKEVLHLLGETSSELFGFSGAANVPFQRIATIDRGTIAPHANAQEDQGLFLIGDDRMAYRISGTQLQRISQHAIERTWQKYTATSDCFGTAFSWNGHKFVPFTFPSHQSPLGDTSTWAYDISTQMWHERLSYDLNGTPLGRWRGNCAIAAYGKVLIGDSRSGKIGYLTDTVQTEFDDPMYAEAVSPPYADPGHRRLFCSLFQLDMEVGVGTASGQGEDPVAMLSISNDGGHTWSDLIPYSSLGQQGQYGVQLRWDRLGSDYQWAFKVRITDPVKKTILRAKADFTPGVR